MKKFLLCISVSLFALNAQADDGVVINTNVLNSLTQTNSVSEPKFPIMPKRIEKPKVAPKEVPAPKPVAKASPAPKPQVEQIKEQEDLQKQFEAMPTVVAKSEDVIKEVKEVAKPVVNNQPAPSKEKSQEKVFDQYHQPQTLELVPGQKVADIPQEEPTQKQEPKTHSGNIVFESYEAKLSEANKTELDKIIATFKDPVNNKISIVAYNIEDGVDAFKKKRQVLDHALEIRNYLAQKGYNNLSLRVLSIKDDASKTNMVTVTEI